MQVSWENQLSAIITMAGLVGTIVFGVLVYRRAQTIRGAGFLVLFLWISFLMLVGGGFYREYFL